MRLCIFGIEDLDALESAVFKSFGTVSPSPSSQLDFSHHGLPLEEQENGCSSVIFQGGWRRGQRRGQLLSIPGAAQTCSRPTNS